MHLSERVEHKDWLKAYDLSVSPESREWLDKRLQLVLQY